MNKSLLTSLFYAIFMSLQSQPIFNSRGIGGGGALFFPKINPANENEFYIACDMSQMFHSTDYGKSYKQSHFSQLAVLNNSTWEFTRNPLIAYTNFNDGNEGYPVRTADGGKSWQKLPGFDENEGHVYKMRANFEQPEQIILNYYDQIVMSQDGGNTFKLVRQAANNDAGIILSGTYFEGNTVVIASNEGLFRSTDNGKTFTPLNATGIPADQVIWDFSAAREGGSVRFVCITGNTADIYNGLMPYEYDHVAAGVFVMNNMDGKWLSRSSGIDFENDFVMYTGMAENNIRTIYLAGNDNALGAPLVFKSSDAGNSWQKVFRSAGNANISTGWSGYGGDKNWSWGETAFGMAVAPYNADRVLFGDYSFVHVSKDGGNSWSQAYVSSADENPAGAPTPKKKAYHGIGLENTSCWQIFWTDAKNMFGCFSDIGLIRSRDGGESWSYDFDGLSVNSVYRMVSDPSGTLYAASSNIHDMYQSTRLADALLDANDSNGKISFSKDKGQTWSVLHQFNHPVYWLATDPANPTRLYASVIHYGGGSGMGGIWVSQDIDKGAGSVWTKLPNAPRTEGHPASIQVLKDGKVLCTFSGRRNANGAFTRSSGLFLYTPSTKTWQDLSDPGMYYWCKDVVVDPSDPTENTWYVCVFSGWGGAPNDLGGLYRTTNRGQSWENITGSLFDRVTSVTFDTKFPHTVWLTTETQGLWWCDEINSSAPQWVLINTYDFRQPERIYFNPFKNRQMWVGSFGNGMKFSDLENSTGTVNFKDVRHTAIFQNPVVSRKLILPEGHNGNLKIFPVHGLQPLVIPYGAFSQGCIDTDSWPAGVYLAIDGVTVQKLIKI